MFLLKNKARKQYKKTRITTHKTEYNRLNKQIKNLIQRTNINNWENKCNDLELKDNQTKTWQQIKQMTGNNKQKTS